MLWGFRGGLEVKNSLEMQEPQKFLQECREALVCSLDQEDPLEEGIATHSSILAWRIPQTKEPGGLRSIGSQRVGHDLSDLARTQQRIHLKILKMCLISLEDCVTFSAPGTWRQQPQQRKDSDVDRDRK